MKLLLDTNALLWWLADSPRLNDRARSLISDPENEILVSVVSLWEIAIKVRIGKLDADPVRVEDVLIASSFLRLGILPDHLKALMGLPSLHRDPFDHLLIAQAISEAATFVTGDRQAELYPVMVVAAGH